EKYHHGYNIIINRKSYMQIAILSKQIYRYTWEREDVMLILSVTGIDIFSPMLITVEIVDIRRFSTPFRFLFLSS
ncbi:MAG: hypothetical protein ACRD47_10480, partial [Nitrososphaeraceae archaeon]